MTWKRLAPNIAVLNQTSLQSNIMQVRACAHRTPLWRQSLLDEKRSLHSATA
ncbi:MAG: hypothetical protein SW833_24565 [Cyanobacteriota bacterium]|nr:hypothetical protein [Cyanobacteriota bacterium]